REGRLAGYRVARVRDAPRMHAEDTEAFGDLPDAKPLADAEDEIVVHRNAIAQIQTSNLFDHGTFEEEGWLGVTVAFANEQSEIEIGRESLGDAAASGVNHVHVPVGHADIRVPSKELPDRLQRARRVRIVRVQPAEDIPRRHVETFVQRIGLAGVRFRYP